MTRHTPPPSTESLRKRLPAGLPAPAGTLTLDLGDGPRAYALIDLDALLALPAPPPPGFAAEDETPYDPEELAEDLAALAEDKAARAADDLDALAEGRATRTAGAGIPGAAMARILDGEPALTVLAEARRLKQADLAAAAGISSAYLSQIVKGRRKGRLETWRKLAAALDAPLELLLPEQA